jgi:hypothetical protein
MTFMLSLQDTGTFCELGNKRTYVQETPSRSFDAQQELLRSNKKLCHE